jgi:hypothetical protein
MEGSALNRARRELSANSCQLRDILMRGIVREIPRRVLLRVLSSIGLASLSSVFISNRDADARKRKRKKKCKGGKKKCGKTCIPETRCCVNVDCLPGTGQTCQDGLCACPPGDLTCDGICVDLETDGANCGVCGTACDTGECVHGACTCGSNFDCPAGCACADRLQGGGICFLGGNTGQSCDNDDDCPDRSACFSNNFCSAPCPG